MMRPLVAPRISEALARAPHGRSPGLRSAYGVDLLETRQVWTPELGKSEPGKSELGTSKAMGAALPPRDLAGFIKLGNSLVKSDRIALMIEAHGAPSYLGDWQCRKRQP